MIFLPICVTVSGRTIVVIGGGKVALQKLRTLILTPADIRVYAPLILDEIQNLPCLCQIMPYEPSLLDGAFLVYACTDDRAVNRLIAADATARGILVNTADDPDRCDFISPALWIHDHMTVAVSSDAVNPKQSVEWRNAIRKYGEHDLV